jgi:integrating conjugative element protein (TIGR03757 family)
MNLLPLQRAAWFLVASTGAAPAADTARIEVFTTAGTPVTGISAPAVHVYILDTPARIEAEINAAFPRDPSTAHRYAQRALKGQWHEAAERLTQAYRGLLKGSQYGLEKLPAIVFDGRAVVYGITDLDEALGDYRRWKARSP